MWKTEFSFIKQLLKRLGVSLLGLTVIRFVFLINNHSFFDDVTLLEGLKLFFFALRFDLVAVVYANMLLILFSLLPTPIRSKRGYQSFLKVLFIVFNALLFFIEIIDIGFYRFAFRRTVFSDLSMFSNNRSNLLSYFIEYWWLVLLLFGMIFGLVLFARRTVFFYRKEKWYFQLIVFILGLGLTVLGARGGTQLRPISPITATKYTQSPVQAHLVTNTTINLIFSLQGKAIKPKHYFIENELDEIYSIRHHPQPNRPFLPKNVVFIIMESLSKEYTGAFAKKPYTPFFDSLVKESYYLEHTYANGLRSTEGIAAITAGLPHLMQDAFIFSDYQTNKLDALAGLLEEKDYYSVFFHGSYEGSMAFESFSKLQGYDDFRDKSNYNNDADFDGHWGIWDIPFFEYTADQITGFQQPFFATLFSLTSHHPYNVEPWFEKKYPDMDKHFRTVKYADLALKRFFEKAKKTDWYDNTLFVITGDHTGPRISKPYQTALGQFKSPILLFDPKGELKGIHKGLTQHIDIIPSVLDFLNYDLPFNSFGHSMLDTTSTNYAIMHTDLYQICDEQYILRFDGNKSLFLFDYQKDPLNQQNLIDKRPAVVKRLERQLKARLQRYNKSMIENGLAY